MADSIMHFLIQWEDRYLSVIERKHILHPVKGELEYYEGELITALFGKQKTYEAVICEIHREYILRRDLHDLLFLVPTNIL